MRYLTELPTDLGNMSGTATPILQHPPAVSPENGEGGKKGERKEGEKGTQQGANGTERGEKNTEGHGAR